MAVLEDYVGQVLDEKYRLERLLGQGGMGAVYLATHLGTERYVALKLITPQFMSNQEFVERFKREAKAAGRLRHPNVVDVTDFGFAHAGKETVAYLVMEYLDGCTLGDVLKEEDRLPLEWVVDILEQVCSAVHEAHQQGIIHRDLKPENIWLEPNRLGGYRVKVLDFGIAKLGQSASASVQPTSSPVVLEADSRTKIHLPSKTHHGHSAPESTAMLGAVRTQLTNTDASNSKLESDTLIYETHESPEDEPARPTADGASVSTRIFAGVDMREAGTILREDRETVPSPATQKDQSNDHFMKDDDGTLLLNKATRPFVAGARSTGPGPANVTALLTRAGAIMGTPVYMSPEQCAGKSSDARSDIYSLGVIAYQMLVGEPPFTGDTANVMREHLETMPVPLAERTKVPKRVGHVVMSALAKNADDRPQTAFAFANSLRAQAEGVGSLYRRAFALYSEYFPKFLKLSLIAHIPVIISTLMLVGLELAERTQPKGWGVVKISLTVALVLVGLVQIAAYFVAAAAISGMTAVIVTQISAAPLRPVELRTAFAVLKSRWRPFLNTSLRVTIRIILGYLCFIVPGFVISVRYALYAPVVLMEGLEKKAARIRARELGSRSWRTVIIVSILQFVIPITVSFLVGRLSFRKSSGPTGVSMEQIHQQLLGLVNIVVIPLMSIVPALLYLKMRQLGGESLSAALAQIEAIDDKRSQWQQRMRTRLTLPTLRSKP